MAEARKKSLACDGCGAPIAFLEGEATLTCGYCGRTTMLASMGTIIPVQQHLLRPAAVDRPRMEAGIRAWMGEGFFKPKDLPQRAALGEPQGIVLPFWVVDCRAFTHWSGQNRRTRTRGSGKSRRTETYYVPDSGSFEADHHWAVYARRGEEWFGIDALNPGAVKTDADWGGFFLNFGLGDQKSEGMDLTRGAVPFQVKGIPEGMAVQNGQINQEQAEAEARGQIARYARHLADGKVDTLTDCDTTISVKGTSLVHVPLWSWSYTYDGKPYRLLLDGGSGRVIKGEHPVGKYDKLVVAAATLLGLGGIAALIWYLVNNRS